MRRQSNPEKTKKGRERKSSDSELTVGDGRQPRETEREGERVW